MQKFILLPPKNKERQEIIATIRKHGVSIVEESSLQNQVTTNQVIKRDSNLSDNVNFSNIPWIIYEEEINQLESREKNITTNFTGNLDDITSWLTR